MHQQGRRGASMMMFFFQQWVTRIALTWCMGAGLTGLLFLVTHNPWASVFACGAGVGWLLLDLCETSSEARDRRDEVAELEKQVIVLRSAMQDMAVMHDELETRVDTAAYKRAGFRRRGVHSQSSSSL